MDKHEELVKQVRDSGTLKDRLKECQKRIAKMCSDRRPPLMTIPVQYSDDDFFIIQTLTDALEAYELLGESNEVIRSAHAIAERRGQETNWDVFDARTNSLLQRQHEILKGYWQARAEEAMQKVS